MPVVDQALHGDRAQIGDVKVGARLQGVRNRGSKPDAEPAVPVEKAEEHGFRARAEGARFGGRKQRVEAVAGLFQHHHVATDRIGERGALDGRQERRIAAPLGGPIDQTVAIAKARLGAEVGTGGHGYSGGSAKLAWPVRRRNEKEEVPEDPAGARSGRERSSGPRPETILAQNGGPVPGNMFYLMQWLVVRGPRANPTRSTWPSPTNRS